MNLLVVVPWRAGCPHRERALAWVVARWQETGVQPVLAVAPPGSWCKAHVGGYVADTAPGTVVVVHDADCWSAGTVAAIDAVARAGGWAVPHLHVRRLNRQATDLVYAGADPDRFGPERLTENPYPGVPGGGIVVAARDVLLDVPFDARFEGWGGEDHSLGYALHTLHGAPWRGGRPLTHLWHPPQPRASRKVGSRTSEELRRRYRAAHGNEADMRRIVNEAKEAARGVPVQAQPQGHP